MIAKPNRTARRSFPRAVRLLAALCLLSPAGLAADGTGDGAANAPLPLALLGATLVDGTGAPPLADAAVVVGDGRVRCAGARADCPVPEGVETVDLTGHWITPGLVDAHVHFSQTGWADGRPDSLDVRSLYPYEEVEASLRAHPERFWRRWTTNSSSSLGRTAASTARP